MSEAISVYDLLNQRYPQLPTRSKFLEVNYVGATTGTDYFLLADGVSHPLYSKDSDILFEQLLAYQNSSFFKDTEVGKHISTQGATKPTTVISNRQALNTCGLENFERRMSSPIGFKMIPRALNSFEMKYDVDYKCFQMHIYTDVSDYKTSNFKFVHSITKMPTSASKDTEVNAWYPFKKDCNGYIIYDANDTQTYATSLPPTGWYIDPGIHILGLEAADKSMGYYWQLPSANQIIPPRLSGYRSVGVAFTGNHLEQSAGGSSISILWGFVPGEGTAQVRFKGAMVVYAEKGDTGGIFTIPDFDVTVNVPYQDVAVYGIGDINAGQTAWPLSRITSICGDVVGTVIKEDLIEVQVDTKVFDVTSITVDVDRVVGSILKSDFLQMAQTGLGVLTPPSADRLALIEKSWESVPSAIYYVVKSHTLDESYSWDKTNQYRHRGKVRAKACKDNDFMDLSFNQEFTFGGINAHLSRMRVINTVAYCDYQVATQNTESVDKGTVTFSVVNGLVGAVHAPSGSKLSGLPPTADSLNVVMSEWPGSKLAGDLTWLTDATTLDIKEYNQSTDRLYELSVLFSAVSAYKYDSAEEALARMSYDDKVIFLSHQYADYRQFSSSWASLIKTVSGERVLRPFLLKE